MSEIYENSGEEALKDGKERAADGSQAASGDPAGEFAKRMKEIASDLWGGIAGSGVPVRTGSGIGSGTRSGAGADTAGKNSYGANTKAVTGQMNSAGNSQPHAQKAGTPAQAAGRGQDRAGNESKPAAVDIHNLWKSADTTVDWTDALGYPRSRDGLTGEKLWSFYHRMAKKVLDGDLEAYAEVLTTTNPLGDLTVYVNGMVIRTPNADRLECKFECRKDLLKENGKLYLTGLSLRVARDLFAALPVSEIYVEGNLEGQRRIGVTYNRNQLLNRNPVFLNPESFAEECGAMIQE